MSLHVCEVACVVCDHWHLCTYVPSVTSHHPPRSFTYTSTSQISTITIPPRFDGAEKKRPGQSSCNSHFSLLYPTTPFYHYLPALADTTMDCSQQEQNSETTAMASNDMQVLPA